MTDYTFDSLTELFDELNERHVEAEYDETFGDFMPVLTRSHEEFFDNEAGPLGKWIPWFYRSYDAPEDHPTLYVSGRLKRSLSAGFDHIEDIEPREFVWGSAVEYAATHQFGASYTTGIPLIGRNGRYLPAGSRINIPARTFVGFTDETLEQLVDAVADSAVDQLVDGF